MVIDVSINLLQKLSLVTERIHVIQWDSGSLETSTSRHNVPCHMHDSFI